MRYNRLIHFIPYSFMHHRQSNQLSSLCKPPAQDHKRAAQQQQGMQAGHAGQQQKKQHLKQDKFAHTKA